MSRKSKTMRKGYVRNTVVLDSISDKVCSIRQCVQKIEPTPSLVKSIRGALPENIPNEFKEIYEPKLRYLLPILKYRGQAEQRTATERFGRICQIQISHNRQNLRRKDIRCQEERRKTSSPIVPGLLLFRGHRYSPHLRTQPSRS